MNRVTLIGRLGKDPEVRYTPNGKAVGNFSIATDEKWTDKSGAKQSKTEWHRIVVWDKQAELCAEYLSKGRQVAIEGRLTTRDAAVRILVRRGLWPTSPPAAAPAAEQAGEAGGAAAPCNPRSTRSPATATGAEQRQPAPAAGLVVCEYCPDHPHPLNDDGTKCKFPKLAPAPGKAHAPYCCADAKAGGPDHSMGCPHFRALPYQIRICDDCLNLRGKMCHEPSCVFCRRTMKEVGEYLDALLIRPIVDGKRLEAPAPAQGADEIGYCKTCGLDASHGVCNDPRDARIAELEAALRRAHGEGCICVACEKMPARAAPPDREGKR